MAGQFLPAPMLLLVLLLGYLLVATSLLPGPAAAAIAGERDRQAWADLLLTSVASVQEMYSYTVAPVNKSQKCCANAV